MKDTEQNPNSTWASGSKKAQKQARQLARTLLDDLVAELNEGELLASGDGPGDVEIVEAFGALPLWPRDGSNLVVLVDGKPLASVRKPLEALLLLHGLRAGALLASAGTLDSWTTDGTFQPQPRLESLRERFE